MLEGRLNILGHFLSTQAGVTMGIHGLQTDLTTICSEVCCAGNTLFPRWTTGAANVLSFDRQGGNAMANWDSLLFLVHVEEKGSFQRGPAFLRRL